EDVFLIFRLEVRSVFIGCRGEAASLLGGEARLIHYAGGFAPVDVNASLLPVKSTSGYKGTRRRRDFIKLETFFC
ncbi:hypothetical protein IGI04_010365, partial [Brassica rapa subsp. trilocularis]